MTVNPNSRLYEFNENQLYSFENIAIVGDLHGDIKSFESLLEEVNPIKQGIVFLGDYADRGKHGIEVIDGVRTLVKRYPKNVVAIKGNHEDFSESGNPTFRPCDLINEAIVKRGSWPKYFQDEFQPFVKNLYLAAVVPEEALFVHGGISSKIRGKVFLRNPTKEIEEDVLWSDPYDGYGERPNGRGAGVEFGKDVSERVCNTLKVKRIFRSHQPGKASNGPYREHDGRVITTNSSSYYGRPSILFMNPNDSSDLEYTFL